MTGTGRARREARDAAQQAQAAQTQLAQQEEELKRQREREKARAQRLLMRSMRAAGGGIFETDTQQTLGTSEGLG